MAKIILISCVKKKQKGNKIPAKDLYISPLFKKAWKYAETLKVDKIYILSAKYGLLSPETLIDDYDVTLLKMTKFERQHWANGVLQRMVAENIDLDNYEFVILAGKAYSEYLTEKINHYTLPYDRKRSIGYILQFLTNELSKQNYYE